MTHVEGKKVGDIKLYALSTCIWCRKTKAFLDSIGVDYSFEDVDLLEESEKEKVVAEIIKWNPSCSFPTTVINNKECVVGFDENGIKRALKL
jgi:glutaredoxin-like protein NrdH